MPSFLSVLKTIGTGVHAGVAAVAPVAPFLAAVPGFGGPFTTIFNAVALAEQLIPGEGLGASRASMVNTVALANHPELTPAQINQHTADIVRALNALKIAQDQLAAIQAAALEPKPATK